MPKRKRKQFPPGTPCAFCGATDRELEEDHVPPQNLFPSRAGLITVPSCGGSGGCNRSSSLDDENFRNMLILQEEVEDHPAIQKPLAAMLRSFQHSPKTAAGFAKNWQYNHVFTPSYLYRGMLPTYKASRTRMNVVVEKTIRGLYYYETQTVLPQDWFVHILDKELIAEIPHPQTELNGIIATITAQPQRRISGGIFRYGFIRDGEEPKTIWLLLFFNRIPFLCMTHSRDEFTKRGLPIPA